MTLASTVGGLPQVEGTSMLVWFAVAATAGVLGGVLWLSGRKVIKPLAIIVFGAAGAGATYVIIGGLGERVQGVPPVAWVGAGFLAGGLGGLLLYKFALAVGTALVCAIAAPCLVAALLWTGAVSAGPEGAESWDRVRERAGELRTQMNERMTDTRALEEAMREHDSRATLLGGAREAVMTESKGFWDDLTARERTAMVVAAAAGWIVGLVIGLAAPVFSGVVWTSALGAALWIPAVVWMGLKALPSALDYLPGSVSGWGIVYGVIVLAGVIVQCVGMRSAARQASPKPAEK